MRDRSSLPVLAWLLCTAACESEPAPASPSAPAAPSAPAPSEAPTPAAAPATPRPAEPPAPPPSGHAVVADDATVYLTATATSGVKLPGPGTSQDPGFTFNVVGEHGDRLAVETLAAGDADPHCSGELSGLAGFRLRLYVARADLLPITTAAAEHEFSDGTSVKVLAGVPQRPDGMLVAGGVPVHVPEAKLKLGTFAEPSPPISTLGMTHTLAPPEEPSDPLLYDRTREIDEHKVWRDGIQVLGFATGTTASGNTWLEVRARCLAAKVIVPAARVQEEVARLRGTLAGDEDVWGGLTGTEIGEAYGVGGLGLIGIGRTEPEPRRHLVKVGTAVTWVDGTAAGQVIGEQEFTAEPRVEGGRWCFDVPMSSAGTTPLTLCFPEAEITVVEPPADTEAGTIGLGNVGLIGHGSGAGMSRGGVLGGVGKRVPQVRQAKAEVKGALDKDIIRRIVRAHINEVRYCYNQGLTKDPKLEGRVEVDFTIGPTGNVTASTTAEDTTGDAAVAACITKAVKRWKFPKPTGGGVVAVTYPFVLSPG